MQLGHLNTSEVRQSDHPYTNVVYRGNTIGPHTLHTKNYLRIHFRNPSQSGYENIVFWNYFWKCNDLVLLFRLSSDWVWTISLAPWPPLAASLQKVTNFYRKKKDYKKKYFVNFIFVRINFPPQVCWFYFLSLVQKEKSLLGNLIPPTKEWKSWKLQWEQFLPRPGSP